MTNSLAYKIRSGAYYSDLWISQYFSIELLDDEPFSSYEAVLYNPENNEDSVEIILRQGTNIISRDEEIGPGGNLNLSGSLPNKDDDERRYLSIKADKAWSPGGGDERVLGLVLVSLKLNREENGKLEKFSILPANKGDDL